MTLTEYVEARIDRSGGPDACWPWLLGTDKDGYGKAKFGGETIRPHRRYFEAVEGPLKPGEIACHTCDNPPCCNPAHIFSGTHAANAADRNAKGRMNPRIGSEHGYAKLTEAIILDIRARVGQSQASIAKEFGVRQSLVSLIRNRKIWKHV